MRCVSHQMNEYTLGGFPDHKRIFRLDSTFKPIDHRFRCVSTAAAYRLVLPFGKSARKGVTWTTHISIGSVQPVWDKKKRKIWGASVWYVAACGALSCAALHYTTLDPSSTSRSTAFTHTLGEKQAEGVGLLQPTWHKKKKKKKLMSKFSEGLLPYLFFASTLICTDHTHTRSHTHTLTHSHTHTLTHSHTHSHCLSLKIQVPTWSATRWTGV